MLSDVLPPLITLLVTAATVLVTVRFCWYAKVRNFVNDGDYVMHYQPVVRAGRVVALEALICLPVALSRGAGSKERVTGYIESVSLSNHFTLEVFCAVMRDYERYFRQAPAVIISINIPPPRDVCCNDLVNHILTTLQQAALPGDTLMLEMTERTPVPSKAQFMRNLGRLRAGGVLLAIDDAGKGRSGDIMALHFPFDYVKTEITLLKDERMWRSETPLRTAMREARRGVIVEHIQTAQDAALAASVCHRPLLQGCKRKPSTVCSH